MKHGSLAHPSNSGSNMSHLGVEYDPGSAPLCVLVRSLEALPSPPAACQVQTHGSMHFFDLRTKGGIFGRRMKNLTFWEVNPVDPTEAI